MVLFADIDIFISPASLHTLIDNFVLFLSDTCILYFSKLTDFSLFLVGLEWIWYSYWHITHKKVFIWYSIFLFFYLFNAANTVNAIQCLEFKLTKEKLGIEGAVCFQENTFEYVM